MKLKKNNSKNRFYRYCLEHWDNDFCRNFLALAV